MHIPNAMLNGAICPITAALSATGITAAAAIAIKSENKPRPVWFAATASLIFALQMLNFPIASGTSGHLLGGVLASAILGTPFGVLAIAAVVAAQALLFSDGGMAVMGANLFNMAIIGAGLGGLLRSVLAARQQTPLGKHLATAVAAWFSVVLASSAVSVELAVNGKIAFSQILPAMVGTHALIGIGEAGITLAFCFLLAGQYQTTTARAKAAIALPASLLAALLLAPFASSLPDGLESIATRFSLIHESAPAFVSPMSGYAIPHIGSTALATIAAGLVGMCVVFALTWLTAKTIFSAKQNI